MLAVSCTLASALFSGTPFSDPFASSDEVVVVVAAGKLMSTSDLEVVCPTLGACKYASEPALQT